MKSQKFLFLKSLNIISLPLLFLAVLFFGKLQVNAASGVKINSTNFPDQKFKTYISSNFDANTDGTLDEKELSEVTTIDITNQGISSLVGIANFKDLKVLICPFNNLTGIDLGANTKLTKLECYSNSKLTGININYCTELVELRCDNCALQNLNVANNTKLEYLNCRNNKLNFLNVAKNTALKELRCHQNNLPSLDLSTNTKLTYLSCYNNSLKSLSLKNNKELTSVYCYYNQLTSLDVTGCSKLVELDCSNNKLTSVDLNGNQALKVLYCNENELTDLYVNNNNKLEELVCYSNKIKKIRVSTTGTLKKKYDDCKKEIQDDKTVKYIKDSVAFIHADGDTEIVAIKSTVNESTVDEEAATAFVERLYYSMFEREPDANKSTWVNGLVNKTMTGADVAKGFVLSDECINYKYSNEVFVEKLYYSFFDRKPDANKDLWVNELKAGKTREYVLSGFTNSDEFTKLCDKYGIVRGTLTVKDPYGKNNNNNNNNNNKNNNNSKLKIDASNVDSAKLDEFVERLYTEALGRPSDAEGKENWKKAIISGQYDAGTVARIGFFCSDEYKAKGKTNEQFVHDAYRAFFGRDEDQGGYDMWVKALYDGKYNREQVIEEGFGYSDEFKNLLRSYGFKIYE